MGGNAIKMSRRVSKERYDTLYNTIKPIVEKEFGVICHRVSSFKNKADFGDLDLLILDNNINYNVIDRIKSVFKPEEIFDNGGVISFNYEELQVDFIMTPLHNWNTSIIFFEHGDLGNLMGKIINNFGGLNKHGFLLKYGYDGFKCKLMYDSKIKVIEITKDMRKVFSFLGLDFNQWVDGFEDKYHIFDYIIKSKYFDYESFQWENLNNINKYRNKRRPNYIDFLEYIEPYKERIIIWNDYKDELNLIKEHFGIDLLYEMNMFQDSVKSEKLVNSKFNGNTIASMYPNIPKVMYSEILRDFRNSLGFYNLYSMEVADIKIHFNEFLISNFPDII